MQGATGGGVDVVESLGDEDQRINRVLRPTQPRQQLLCGCEAKV